MAKHQVSASAHGIKKQTTNTGEVRRSARLKVVSQLEGNSKGKQQETGLSSVGEASRDQVQPSASHESPLKRNGGQKAPRSSLSAQDLPSSKRPRTSTPHTAEEQKVEEHTSKTVAGAVQSWVQDQRWPPEYFKPDSRTREELLEHDSWLEAMMALPPIPVVQYVEVNGFRYPLPIKKIDMLRRRQSQSQLDPSVTGSSTSNNRDSKSVQYRNPRYVDLLGAKGSFLHDFGYDAPPTTVTNPGRHLLGVEKAVPQNSLFRDDVFRRFCREIEGEGNEAMIVQDVSRLLVPSAKNLAIFGDRHLDILIEHVNAAWTECIPVEGPRPQPDYSVGFRRSAFTEKQLQQLDPLIGSVFDTSYFVATWRMWFPFLTCESKCTAALDIADRQNAHSMTIAVRSVVELYRAVKRERELDREILAFSISHDHQVVHIYGHYAVIDDNRTNFYRHLIKTIFIMSEEGKEKWLSYKFTRNVYDIWMPTHLKRICSAIDQLPSSLDFQVSEPSAQPEEATGLSQDMGSLLSDPDNIDLASQEDELNPLPQTATPNTSVSKEVGQGPAKRAKTTHGSKEPTGRRKK